MATHEIQYQRPGDCLYYGRNGCKEQRGLSVHGWRRLARTGQGADFVRLVPHNSKGEAAGAYLEVEIEAVPALITALQAMLRHTHQGPDGVPDPKPHRGRCVFTGSNGVMPHPPGGGTPARSRGATAMIEYTRRVINGFSEDLYRCRVCTKLRAQAEGAPLLNNGFQLQSRRLVHIPGCPLHEPEQPSPALATPHTRWDAGL